VDLGQPFLAALRARCSETCALLILDEVQCGMGRTGFPFAANMHGIAPDMITTAKALGAGFPCAALLMADHVAAHLKTDDLGTTFGGGPMACALIETVVDIIESEGLLANVRSSRSRSAQVRRRAGGGDARRRTPARACARAVPRRTCSANCSSSDILTGTAATRTSCASSRRTCSPNQHVEQLRDALASLPA
jgi:acetylornithine/N-succinyldiaminopimelate aminotransferase